MKFLFLFFLLILAVPFLVLAEEAPPPPVQCPDPPAAPSCSASWQETGYQCAEQTSGTLCGGKSQSRVKNCSSINGSPIPAYDEETGCLIGYSGCSGPYSSSCGSWSGWSDLQTCSSFQICQAQTSPPSCACSGSCYPAPTLKPVKEVKQNVLDQEQKIKLPVKLDWEGPADIEPCLIDSYQYRVTGDGAIENSATESEAEMKNCALNSNSSYDWQARACLQEECGKWSDQQNFSTSLAPELLLPYDPDWEKGPEKAEDVSLPVTLDWCDVKEAQSYALQIYIEKNGQESCHPWLKSGQECQPIWLSPVETEGKTKLELFSKFEDENSGYFTKDTIYKWSVGAFTNKMGAVFSQAWKFLPTGLLPRTVLFSPPNDPYGNTPAGLPLTLKWTQKPGVNSFVYEITPVSTGSPITGFVLAAEKNLDYPQLSLSAFYKWRVKACSDFEGEQCEDNFTEEWRFKTTGQPPSHIFPAAGATNVIIPVNFDWQDVPGAKSYIFKIQGSGLAIEKPTDKSEIILGYPNLKMSADYSWQVKTCAREEGQICGAYSSPQNFKTFKLPPPGAPETPQGRGVLFTDEHYLSWEKVNGAKAYQYQVKYLSLAADEKDRTCADAVGKEIFGQPKNSPINSDSAELKCLGNYQWQVLSCLDANCRETSDWSSAWTFALSEGGAAQGGLVPCGRKADNPNTPWNEREPCQIKHIFLLVKTMIDFFLFRLIPLVLVLLTLYSGLTFYLSLGKAGTLAQVISLWKSVGIGLAIAFFAWLFINIFLKLIGYQIGVFGQWQQIL